MLTAIVIFLSKTIIASYFFVAAIADVRLWKQSISLMQSKRLPFPELGLSAAILLKITCSIALFFNAYRLYGALGLAAFTLVCNYIFNDFWKESGDARWFSLIKFLSSLSVIAGLLLLMCV